MKTHSSSPEHTREHMSAAAFPPTLALSLHHQANSLARTHAAVIPNVIKVRQAARATIMRRRTRNNKGRRNPGPKGAVRGAELARLSLFLLTWMSVCVRATENKTHPCADEWQHYPLVERQSLALLHFNSLFVEALHGVHFAGVRLAAAVDFSEPSSTYDAVNTEVVHCQLK